MTDTVVSLEELAALLEEARQDVHAAEILCNTVSIIQSDVELSGQDAREVNRLGTEADRYLRVAYRHRDYLRDAHRRLATGQTSEVVFRDPDTTEAA